MLVKCTLDVAGILIGYIVDPDPATVQPGDVTFDHQPDLELGKYRWDGEKFVPANQRTGFTPDGPDAWFAFYRLCRRLEKQNIINIPAPTKVWMEYYRKAFTNDTPEEV